LNLITVFFQAWIISKKAEVNTGLTDGGGNVEPSTFICTIKEMTNLRLVLLVVASMQWFFDFHHMASFCSVHTPLYSCSIVVDVGSDTLHKFELRDVPVVDNGIAFAGSCSRRYDYVLVIMQFFECGIYFSTY
jgi:hypothetical protein